MINTQSDDNTMHELSLISGVDELEIRKVFEAFLIQFTFKYTNNKQIHIPYIGNFMIRYRKDEETAEGKEAQVDAFYSPHDEIRRIVGQLKDAETSGDYTDLDTYTTFKKILKNDFKVRLSDD